MANDYAKSNINVELAKVAKTMDLGQVCPHNRRERLPKALDQLLGPHKAQRNIGFNRLYFFLSLMWFKIKSWE